MKGRTTTIVCGAYSTTRPLWRHTSKAPLEAKMWMAQGTASGMAPLLHWLGGDPKDFRWMETGRNFYQWMARNQEHFMNESCWLTLLWCGRKVRTPFIRARDTAKILIICRGCIRSCSRADSFSTLFTKTI